MLNSYSYSYSTGNVTPDRLLPEAMRNALVYAGTHSPFYQKVFAEKGIKADAIQRYSDFRQLPLTTKADIAKDYRRFVCITDADIVDRTCTSGTSGAPVTFVLSERDIQRLAANEASALAIAGISREDIVQLCTTMDQRFMAGLAYFLGLRKIGASVIRQGVGTLAGQWNTILSEKPTALICVPSFLHRLIRYAVEHRIDYRSTNLKRVVCIGESIRREDFSFNELGHQISQLWPGLQLHSTYASTEMGAAFTECAAGRGGHHNPDLIEIEVLNPQGQPVANGQPGELVITTLGVEAMPLIRFKTGDLVTAHADNCECGRPGLRIGPVLGRLNQMLKVRGTTIYVPAVQDVINRIDNLNTYIIEATQTSTGQDHLRIYYTTSASTTGAIEDVLQEHCRARLRLRPELVCIDKQKMQILQFPTGGRKPRIFMDNR